MKLKGGAERRFVAPLGQPCLEGQSDFVHDIGHWTLRVIFNTTPILSKLLVY